MHAVDDGDAEIAAAAYAEGVRDGVDSREPDRPPGTHHWEVIAAAALLAAGIVIAGIERGRSNPDANPLPTVAVVLSGVPPDPVPTIIVTASPEGADEAADQLAPEATPEPVPVPVAVPGDTQQQVAPAPVPETTSTSTRQVPNGGGYGPNVMPPKSQGKR